MELLKIALTVLCSLLIGALLGAFFVLHPGAGKWLLTAQMPVLSAVLVATVTVIGNVWLARITSHAEHKKTEKKVDELSNGGLIAAIRKALSEWEADRAKGPHNRRKTDRDVTSRHLSDGK